MPRTTLLRKQVTPTGTIQPHAGPTAPEGFLVCDGTIVDIADYPRLYAAIGTSWGHGNEISPGVSDGLTFHLPDLRGRALRGCDGGTGRDNDASTRTPANAGGNAGDNVGSVQGDATRRSSISASTSGNTSNTGNHAHQLWANRSNTGNNNNAPNYSNVGVTGESDGNEAYIGSDTADNIIKRSGSHFHSISASTSISGGDDETRMKNANVIYVIKAV